MIRFGDVQNQPLVAASASSSDDSWCALWVVALHGKKWHVPERVPLLLQPSCGSQPPVAASVLALALGALDRSMAIFVSFIIRLFQFGFFVRNSVFLS